ncbi:putative inosine-uridine preferring nucleoside hydrolase [Salvia divinorum]|uniref:Inosine-uridine preferring nucleoside hydrolase n=1 Tax=Salvia divinorum TaxID=28513 RepID=A0ABD1GGD4_SALDI
MYCSQCVYSQEWIDLGLMSTYQHAEMILWEILGAVVVAGNDSDLKTTYGTSKVKVLETGALSEDGEMMSSVRAVEDGDSLACYDSFAARLGGN